MNNWCVIRGAWASEEIVRADPCNMSFCHLKFRWVLFFFRPYINAGQGSCAVSFPAEPVRRWGSLSPHAWHRNHGVVLVHLINWSTTGSKITHLNRPTPVYKPQRKSSQNMSLIHEHMNAYIHTQICGHTHTHTRLERAEKGQTEIERGKEGERENYPGWWKREWDRQWVREGEMRGRWERGRGVARASAISRQWACAQWNSIPSAICHFQCCISGIIEIIITSLSEARLLHSRMASAAVPFSLPIKMYLGITDGG